jgi:hypothetical protein
MDGRGVDRGAGRESFTADFVLPGRMRMRFAVGNQNVAIILADGASYFLGDRSYWAARAHSARVVDLLTNRWIRVPSSATARFGPFLAWTNPATIGRCLIGRHGTLTRVGTTTDGGRPVVVLKDKGDVPGDSPALAYISATGAPLPERAMQTGPTRPGGTPDRACGETSVHHTTQESNIVFSRFDGPVQISAPQNALTIPGLSPAA